MNLQQMLAEYLKHQENVVTRRTRFDLDKAEKRAHILEGLRIAIDNIDEVIRIIREEDEYVRTLRLPNGLGRDRTARLLVEHLGARAAAP